MIPQEYPRSRTFDPGTWSRCRTFRSLSGEIYERAKEGAIDRIGRIFSSLFLFRCSAKDVQPRLPFEFPYFSANSNPTLVRRIFDQRTICLRNFLIWNFVYLLAGKPQIKFLLKQSHLKLTRERTKFHSILTLLPEAYLAEILQLSIQDVIIIKQLLGNLNIFLITLST